MIPELEALVLKYGLPLLAEALVDAAEGATLQDLAARIERRLARLAADAEAKVVLDE